MSDRQLLEGIYQMIQDILEAINKLEGRVTELENVSSK